MFTLAFDRRHKILLARVSGVLSSSDVVALDGAIERFTARNGPAHGLMDFTSVSTVAVPDSMYTHSSPIAFRYSGDSRPATT